ncbi:sialate O-acetylesterase, partial [Klebsiella pneumoniae]
MPDAWDNMQSIDKFVNSSDETITTRTGEQLDTLHGVNVKADNQLTQQQADFETSQEERDAVVEETRQNLIPLSKQYMTLEAAQADIANIPAGSTTYVRSQDGSSLADEYINLAGTLQPTGRRMLRDDYGYQVSPDSVALAGYDPETKRVAPFLNTNGRL